MAYRRELVEAESPAAEVQVGGGNHRPFWRPFLTRAEKARIVAAIEEQETRSTGEICVHVMARTGTTDSLEFARRKFLELGLEKTAERNGVLILISRWDHRFAIWGDAALHDRSGQELWNRAKEALAEHFAEQQFAEGIEACVREVGGELARHFPKAKGPGRNQLSNEISMD